MQKTKPIKLVCFDDEYDTEVESDKEAESYDSENEKTEETAGGGESKDEPPSTAEEATEATTLRALLETMNAKLEGIVVRQNLVDERMNRHTVFRRSGHTSTNPGQSGSVSQASSPGSMLPKKAKEAEFNAATAA